MVLMAQGVYQSPISDVPTLRLIRKALTTSYDSLKEASIVMEWDFATFSRALHGLAPMDVTRLAKLSPKFWFKFDRLMIAAKLAARETDTLNERRSA